MNAFDTVEGLLGEAGTQRLRRVFDEFLEQSRLIRDKLGRQAYLFDRYLSLLLEAANVDLAYDAASAGFSGQSPMLMLCAEILKREPRNTENPIYDIMKSYIEANPLPYQEDVTKRTVYYSALSGDLLESAVDLFIEELNERFRAVADIVELRDLYQKICAILCGEDEMEKLNLLFRQRFLIATPVAIFIQGATNQLLYSLLHRDWETSKQVFQLILDEMPRATEKL